jgi:hypothetical protein
MALFRKKCFSEEVTAQTERTKKTPEPGIWFPQCDTGKHRPC